MAQETEAGKKSPEEPDKHTPPEVDEEHQNEGEGSRTAARRYGEGVRAHIARGQVQAEADEAMKDLEKEPESYERAEAEGRRHSAGELPEDLE